MLEVDTATALAGVDHKIGKFRVNGRSIKSGHAAAVQIIRLMHESQKRLSPMDIIETDDPTKNAPQRARDLWANSKVRQATIQSLADSTMLLADLWSSAWLAGGGRKIDSSEIVTFKESQLMKVYRDRKFAESLSLVEMAESGRFEAPERVPATGRRRRPGKVTPTVMAGRRPEKKVPSKNVRQRRLFPPVATE
jgi:hypothetical protein